MVASVEGGENGHKGTETPYAPCEGTSGVHLAGLGPYSDLTNLSWQRAVLVIPGNSLSSTGLECVPITCNKKPQSCLDLLLSLLASRLALRNGPRAEQLRRVVQRPRGAADSTFERLLRLGRNEMLPISEGQDSTQCSMKTVAVALDVASVLDRGRVFLLKEPHMSRLGGFKRVRCKVAISSLFHARLVGRNFASWRPWSGTGSDRC